MRWIAGVALACLMVPCAMAQRETFVVNADASDVKMTLKTTHEVVNGTFHVQSGTVGFDGAGAMTGSVVVAAGSGKTGNGARDKKMDKDILVVQRFATVAFEPKTYVGSIAAEGDSAVKITGVFTLLGVAHEITVPVTVHVEQGSASAKAHFVLQYGQWGVKNPSFLIWEAENDVAMDVDLVGRLEK